MRERPESPARWTEIDGKPALVFSEVPRLYSLVMTEWVRGIRRLRTDQNGKIYAR